MTQEIDVRVWTPDAVKQWLCQLGFPQYCETFLENDINGEALVLLDETALSELGISSVGHRMTLLTQIYELKQRFNVPMDQDDWVPQKYIPYYGFPAAPAADISLQLQQRDQHIQLLEGYIERINNELEHMRESLGRISFPTLQKPSTLSVGDSSKSMIDLGHANDPIGFMPGASTMARDTTVGPGIEQIPLRGVPYLGDTAAAAYFPTAPPSTGLTTPTIPQPPHLNVAGVLPQWSSRLDSLPTAQNATPEFLSSVPPTLHDTGPIDDAVTRLLSSHGRSAPIPREIIQTNVNDSCASLLALSLRRHGIIDDYTAYVLFVVFGETERSINYDERPLLLYRRLRESGQIPHFMLRHMSEVCPPTELAESKLRNRHAERHALKHEAMRLRATLIDMDAQSPNDQRVFSVSHWLSYPSFSGYLGEESLRRAKIMGPGAHLLQAQGISFAVAVYPYESDREDEYDVATGDTFVVLSKSKGWWTVRRDSVADGRGDVYMPQLRPSTDPVPAQGHVPFTEIWTGWVPAGCLLELHRPLAECLHGTGNPSPATSIALNTQARGVISPTARLRAELINVPIPLSIVASQGSTGTMLLDYESRDGNLRVRQGERVHVFKRYHHWTYCVLEQSHKRGWLPSWFISRRGQGSIPGSQSSGTQAPGTPVYDNFAFQAPVPSSSGGVNTGFHMPARGVLPSSSHSMGL